ncbi:MAG: divergent polysaccharide deacetylase family protein [Thermoanaerobaculia bacterium]
MAQDPSAPASSPCLAIVVDDLGNDPRALERLLKISEPFAGSVLPELPKSRETALLLRQAGKEVLLHLPMEPLDPRMNPGPGLIRDSMSAEQVESALAADLESVPGADGVNNHMGSKGTADRRTVSALLAALSRRRLFFLDSRTTGSTVVQEEGARLRVPVFSRDVFLDDVPDEPSIERQFDSAEAAARKDGAAVAIGHPHSATLDVLERRLPKLRERGLTACRVSETRPSPLP